MAQTGQRVDPYGNFNFLVEIDGITRAAFHEVTGFDSTIDVIDHREGGENTTLRKLPGMTKHANIVLKYGLTDDAELYQWHRNAVNGNVQRKNGSIVMYDSTNAEIARFNFTNGWPSKISTDQLSVESNDPVKETITLTVESLARVK